LILEKEFRAVSNELRLMTDDGSNGEKGLVTAALEELINAGEPLRRGDRHRAADHDEVRQPHHEEVRHKNRGQHDPIMVDGTGMCGGCRLTVGGETSSPAWTAGFRRSPGGLRRGVEPRGHVPRF
jgi:ferredoxin--NADP+ reductase